MLLTDMVASTQTRVRLGPAFGAVQREHDAMVRAILIDHDSDRVEDTGDGFLATFLSIESALYAACAIQWAADDRNRVAEPADRFKLRVTLAVGELRRQAGKQTGMAFVEASRLEELAGAEEIFCTGNFRAIAEEVAPGLFEHRVDRPFKGLPGPMAVWSVDWRRAGRFRDDVPLPAELDVDRRPFSGRTRELARLTASWQEADPGCGLVLVGGEPGIGKSALVRTLAQRVHERGAWVLYGRCDPSTVRPFQPFAEALTTFRNETDDAPQLLGRAAAHLAPLLRTTEDSTAPIEPMNLEADRYELFEAVTEWLTAISARQRVLLVIDDVAWADRPTLDLLGYVLRANRGSLLVAATYRSSSQDWSEAFSAAYGELTERLGGVTTMTLTGLDTGAVAETVEAVLGADAHSRAFAHELHAYTAGNPLFVHAVLDELDDRQLRMLRATDPAALGTREASSLRSIGIPDDVVSLLARRRARLSESARSLLDAAAVAGTTFDVGVVSAVGDLAPLDAERARRELVAAGLLRGTEGRTASFAHEIARDATLRGLRPDVERALHVRTARQLERRGFPVGAAAELSQHLSYSESPVDRRAAVDYAALAGDRALAALAPSLAASHYRTALELGNDVEPPLTDGDSCDLAAKLGYALKHAGDPSANAQLLDAARRARELGDARRMARVALAALTDAWGVTGAIDPEKVRVLEEALELVGASDLAMRARLLAALSAELTFVDDGQRRTALSDEAIAIARQLGHDAPDGSARSVLARVLEHRHTILLHPGGLDERVGVIAELDGLAEGGQPFRSFNAASYGYWTAMERGDVDECRRRLRTMRELAQTMNQPRISAIAKLWDSTLAMLRGQVAEALRLAAESFELYRSIGKDDALVFDVGLRYQPRWFCGDPGSLIDDLTTCAAAHPLRVAMRAGLAHCRALVGDTDRARRDLASIDLTVRSHHDELPALALTAMASVLLADRDKLGDLLTLLEPWTSHVGFNGTSCFGSMGHYVAQVCSALEQFDRADAHFRDAAAAHASMSAPALLALTKMEWGRTLLDRRALSDGVRARVLLEESLTMSHGLGLEWIGRESHLLLARGG